MEKRPWSAGPRAQLVLDLAVAGAHLLVVLGTFLVMLVNGGRLSAPFLLGLAMSLPLLWRRRHPVACCAVVASACLLQVLTTDYPLLTQTAVPVAIYSVAAFTTARLGAVAMAAGLVGVPLAAADWLRLDMNIWPNWVLLLTAGWMVVVAAWALGTASRTRRAYVDQLVERGVRLEREAAQQAELAARDERTRIAREMHDVVAHGLSVIIVQADGARYAAANDPEVATTALAGIGETGRSALAEMRSLLGLLRGEDTGVRPQPGMDDLPALVAEAEVAGTRIDATLPEAGGVSEVPPGVGLTVYRVVQEALTNIRKHAGPDVLVELQVRVTSRSVAVDVVDDGRGSAAERTAPGHGLDGMRERVGVHGGEVEAGPRQGGGFAVRARIPL